MRNDLMARLLFFLIAIATPAGYATAQSGADAASDRPIWWGNSLGKESAVLPGFEPVRVDGNRIELGGRVYLWDQSYLPVRIESTGRLLAGPMRLVFSSAGSSSTLTPRTVEIASSGPDHAVVRATGVLADGSSLEVTTRVEYDGVAMVDLEWHPSAGALGGGLEFVVPVVREPATRVLAFEAKGFRRQKGRTDMLELPYTGPFLNVIDVADGARSFWWFADHARGWVWDNRPVTRVTTTERSIEIGQRLVAEGRRVDGPLSLQWNFMATPARDLGSSWRGERILYGSPSVAEAALGVKYGIWWTNGLPHDALPYSELDEGQKSLVQVADRKAYPGVKQNRKLIVRDLERFGLHRIPYFSAHVLSTLDPVLLRYRDRWEIEPPFVFKGAHAPWKQSFDRPTLSHQDSSYADYLLYRIDSLIDELGMSGIYLDHGTSFDSMNPQHGLWKDSNGVSHPSLDILGLRSFLKRLATLFHVKGKPGFVFVHSSAREVIPAYAFVTSIVDGEQYRKAFPGGDYIGGLPLDEVRMRFAPDQYGVRMDWLPTAWVANRKEKSWRGSETQKRAYRNFMTLVLLHGTGDWPAGAHPDERRRLIQALDTFEISRAEFHGYWEASGAVAISDEAAVSHFRNSSRSAALLVIGNLSATSRTVRVRLDPAAMGWGGVSGARFPHARSSEAIELEGDELKLIVPARDFRLVIVEQAPQRAGVVQERQSE